MAVQSISVERNDIVMVDDILYNTLSSLITIEKVGTNRVRVELPFSLPSSKSISIDIYRDSSKLFISDHGLIYDELSSNGITISEYDINRIQQYIYSIRGAFYENNELTVESNELRLGKDILLVVDIIKSIVFMLLFRYHIN